MTQPDASSSPATLDVLLDGVERSGDLRGACAARARGFQARHGSGELAELVSRIEPSVESEAAWQLAVECWDLLAADRTDDSSFLESVSEWLVLGEPRQSRVLRLANRIAWTTRGEASLPHTLDSMRGLGGLFTVVVYLERRRFLFQVDGLLDCLDKIPKEYSNHPLVLAVGVFATLAQVEEVGASHALGRLKATWDLTHGDFEAASAARDICLHALSIATRVPDRGPQLLTYCERYTAEADECGYEPYNSVLHYRTSLAHRLNGTWDPAMRSIDAALNGLKGDNEFIRIFSEQCLRERSIIDSSRDLEKLKGAMDAAEKSVKKAERRVDNKLHESTVKSTELLAVFSTAVAFAVGASAIAANTHTPLSAVLASVSLAIGLLGFCSLVVLVVDKTAKSERARKKIRKNSSKHSIDEKRSSTKRGFGRQVRGLESLVSILAILFSIASVAISLIGR